MYQTQLYAYLYISTLALVNLKERHEYDSNDTVKPSYDSYVKKEKLMAFLFKIVVENEDGILETILYYKYYYADSDITPSEVPLISSIYIFVPV